MRHTTVLLLAAVLAVGTVSCSKPADEAAKDCTTALSDRTGSDAADTPTVSEAQERIDALDETLADMVRSGYASVAKKASDAIEAKADKDGDSRPKACEPLSDDDYTTLLMGKAINGLGWTGEGGEFDKLKMADSLS